VAARHPISILVGPHPGLAVQATRVILR